MIFISAKDSGSYESLISSIKAGSLDNLYIFYGEERYLLDRSIISIRSAICPDGLDGFNYKRFDGRRLSVDELDDAVNALPFFADRTLIEIHDFDIFKNEAKQRLLDIFSDLPDYICIVFIYSTIEYKPDGRQKINKQILEFTNVIEFTAQEQNKLVKWIKRHFQDAGKNIDTENAEYLAFITGGLMTSLNGEIEKTAAYAKQESIQRSDIDAVVTPVLDTVIYKLTDALVSRNNDHALNVLNELFQMREAPHRLIFSISLKMRQLLAARICIESNLGESKLMTLCSLRQNYQVRILLNTAKKANLSDCRFCVLCCAETALELNNTSDPEERIIELVSKLALRQ